MHQKKGDVYVLTGKQLQKIFDSTNFNDMGSLRYLYKYVEKKAPLRNYWKWVFKKAIRSKFSIMNLNTGTNINR